MVCDDGCGAETGANQTRIQPWHTRTKRPHTLLTVRAGGGLALAKNLVALPGNQPIGCIGFGPLDCGIEHDMLEPCIEVSVPATSGQALQHVEDVKRRAQARRTPSMVTKTQVISKLSDRSTQRLRGQQHDVSHCQRRRKLLHNHATKTDTHVAQGSLRHKAAWVCK